MNVIFDSRQCAQDLTNVPCSPHGKLFRILFTLRCAPRQAIPKSQKRLQFAQVYEMLLKFVLLAWLCFCRGLVTSLFRLFSHSKIGRL